MDSYIENQLRNCTFVNLDSCEVKNNTYLIKKYTKPSYKVGNFYLIKISPSLINNSNSLTAVNWNSGSFPKYNAYRIVVNSIKGKMLNVTGSAVDLSTKKDINSFWTGWLSIDEIEQLAALD